MNKQKKYLATIALQTSILLFSSIASAETVKVGVILPLTGAFARYGSKIQEAISAFNDPNITFIFEDEGCDPKTAVSAYKKLTDFDKVSIFLGPWCGSPQSAIAPLIKSKNQIALLGSSAPEEVFVSSGSRMYSTQHSIEAESTFLAQRLNELDVSSVITIFKENAFSRAHEAAFIKSFKGKILKTIAYTSDDVSELKDIALKVKQLQPAALYVPDAFPLLSGLVKELKAIGVGDKKIYSVYSAQSDDILKILKNSDEALIYSYPDIDNQEALQYFPSLAAKIILDAVKKCADRIDCVKEEISRANTFDRHGVLAGKITLKTIKAGKFVRWAE
jgi:branched-chain amino acid transport system substrate-binding protein